MSEETRKKISNANKGRIFTEEHRKKIGETSKGRVFSEESKRKMSLKRKGDNNPNSKLTWEVVDEIRKLLVSNTVAEVARLYNLSWSTVNSIKNNISWIR